MWLGKRLSMITAAFLALVLSVVALGQSPSTGVVKKNANLRAGPGTTYAIAGTVTAGQAVTVIGKSAAGDWYELKDGQWIAAFLVTMDAMPIVKPTVKATATPTATHAITTTRLMASTVTPTPVKTKAPAAPAKPTTLTPTSTPLPTAASIPSLNSRCLDVPQSIIDAIAEGLTVSGGGTLDHAKAVKSKDFSKVFFVAAVIHGEGMGVGQIGVWATNHIEAADGLIYSVNAIANEFSDWGDGSTTQAQLSMSNDGATEAEACAKASLSAPTTTPISDGTSAGDWEKASSEQRAAIVHYFYEFWKKNENGNIGISEQEMMACIIDQVALPYTQQHPTMAIMALASRCIKQ